MRQIRPIVDFRARCAGHRGPRPCMASYGVSSSVAVMTSSTLSAGRRRPARPRLIVSPPPPPRGEPARQLPRCRMDPQSAAACLFVAPSAHASTILARSASAWLVLPAAPTGSADHAPRPSAQLSYRTARPVMIGQPRQALLGEPPPPLRTVIRVDPSSAPPAPRPTPAPRTPARSVPAPPATAACPGPAGKLRVIIGQHQRRSSLDMPAGY